MWLISLVVSLTSSTLSHVMPGTVGKELQDTWLHLIDKAKQNIVRVKQFLQLTTYLPWHNKTCLYCIKTSKRHRSACSFSLIRVFVIILITQCDLLSKKQTLYLLYKF